MVKLFDFVDRAFFVEYGFVTSDNLLRKRQVKRDLENMFMQISNSKTSKITLSKLEQSFIDLLKDAGISQKTINKVIQNNLLI